MGLPQEVVDRIMDMLQDDRRALEGCSLTCKAMFVSTRHLIHQTLHVTKENNQRILTPKEKKQHARGNYLLELRFLSFMGERDLLKYTRHLNISIGSFAFSPKILEPHLQPFKSLDRVNTLTVYSYDSVIWRHVYNTHFSQFHPTLTTLVLRSLTSHYRFVLQFVLQFPSLENLTLEYLRHETGEYSGISVPSKVTQYPPLNGRLRCASLYSGDPEWTKEFAFGPLGGINFRSVEFRDVHREHGQHILDGCASSLEEFTVRITGDGKESPPRFFRAAKTERLVHISSTPPAEEPPFPRKQVTPIHHTPYSIFLLARTGSIIPLDESFDHHVSRFLQIRARAGWSPIRVFPTASRHLGKLEQNR